MIRASDGGQRRAFLWWLRTGRLPPALGPDGLELKFNPWHDPANGRFTFAGAGDHHGRPGTERQDRAAGTGRTPRRMPVAATMAAASRRDRPNRAVEFINGIGEELRDGAKDTVAGIRSALTTNPVTTLRETTEGVAAMIDGAIAAEDTPARIQIVRARRALANASARDLGHAVGAVIGNGALAVAPAGALTKVARARYLRKIGPRPTFAPIRIGWTKESLGNKPNATWRPYNDAADGARPGLAPTLMRTMPDGSKRPVKFDGIRGDYVIDRKWSIWFTAKTKAQLLRQSEALAQHRAIGIWEVPNLYERKRALSLFRMMNVKNIKARIVKP